MNGGLIDTLIDTYGIDRLNRLFSDKYNDDRHTGAIEIMFRETLKETFANGATETAENGVFALFDRLKTAYPDKEPVEALSILHDSATETGIKYVIDATGGIHCPSADGNEMIVNPEQFYDIKGLSERVMKITRKD